MTFPILGGNSAVTGAYSIDNSLRFNDGDSATLSRTLSGSGTVSTYTFSAWIKRGNLGGYQYLFSHRASSGSDSYGLAFDTSSNGLYVYAGAGISTTNAVFRDVSAYYHVLLSVSSGSYTLYINNVSQKTGSAQSLVLGEQMNIGNYNYSSGSNYFDGYMAEVHFIDGTAKSPTDFGEFDSDSGIWKPKAYEGSYGTNGFYLDFENSGSLGADQSGNGNNFTPTNLASTDQTTDTPTNNWCTMNSINKSASMLLKEGNLKAEANDTDQAVAGTVGITSGKWYFEFYYPAGDNPELGLMPVVKSIAGASTTNSPTLNATAFITNNGGMRTGNWSTTSTTGLSSQTGESVIGVAVDADNGKMWFTNASGTYFNSGNPATGSNPQATFDSDWLSQTGGLLPYAVVATGAGQFTIVNFGQEGSFAGNKTAQGNADANGFGDFYYAPPSNYLALCTQNLATELSPTISDGSQYFNTVTYTGNGNNGLAITGVGFQPDFTWIKNRSRTVTHILTDSSRGTNKQLHTNLVNGEQTFTDFIASFDTDGFTVNDSANGQGDVNYFNGDSYVGWNWLANGGTTSSNTDGSITSTVQANTTAGFSIVTYTGTGSNATIGHGLGKVPAMMIVKKRSGADDWAVYHNGVLTPSDARYHYVRLNSSDAYAGDGTYWNDTAPTTSVFTVGTNADVNTSGATYVAYIFTDIEGYSKFGTYEGNGSSNGTFVYTGFRPSFILMKNIDAAENWLIYDSKRDPHNVTDEALLPNSSSASGGSANAMDLLSNGFKFRSSAGSLNGSNKTFIYMAFAENPFVSSSGVPVVAR